MSDQAAGPRHARRAWTTPRAGTVVRVVVVVVLAVLPFYLQVGLLIAGMFAFSAIVAAIGLTLLTGVTGQLSLAHAFFVAVGAYAYAYFAASDEVTAEGIVRGMGLPPLVALVLAVLAAGLAGLLFSPISSRLGGIYLGIASLALVFIGQHILFNATAFTGGFNGRSVTPFALFGFTFTSSDPELVVLNVPFGQYERLWYLGLVLVVLSYLFAKNLLAGRPGRALRAIRDGETSAAVMGVNVRRYKAASFVVSSMYAGLGGVLLALTVTTVVPGTFGFHLTVDYLLAIVIGGLGSIGGAAVGAAFVFVLPKLLIQYSDALGFLASPGSGGLDPGTFSNFVFGAAVILVIMFEPEGLAAIGRRVAGLPRRLPRGVVPGLRARRQQHSTPGSARGGQAPPEDARAQAPGSAERDN